MTMDVNDKQISLCDALDRLLSHGIAISGDIVISVAGVELLYVGLRGLLSSIDALDQRPASLDCFKSQAHAFETNASSASTGGDAS